MIYVDTSLLVALHVNEPSTARVVDWYAGTIEGDLATSDWTVPEFASALAIKHRTGQLDARQVNAVWRLFENQCRDEIRLLPIDRDAFGEAASAIRRPNSVLRSGDALHLTVARQTGIEEFATLDRVMQAEARALRMRVTSFA